MGVCAVAIQTEVVVPEVGSILSFRSVLIATKQAKDMPVQCRLRVEICWHLRRVRFCNCLDTQYAGWRKLNRYGFVSSGQLMSGVAGLPKKSRKVSALFSILSPGYF